MGDFAFVCQVTKHLVEKIVQIPEQGKDEKSNTLLKALLLDALSVLCECNGVPIRRNQGERCPVICICRFFILSYTMQTKYMLT